MKKTIVWKRNYSWLAELTKMNNKSQRKLRKLMYLLETGAIESISYMSQMLLTRVRSSSKKVLLSITKTWLTLV